MSARFHLVGTQLAKLSSQTTMVYPGGELMKSLLYVLCMVVVSCSVMGCSKDTPEPVSATGAPSEPVPGASKTSTIPPARSVDAAPPVAKLGPGKDFEIPEGTDVSVSLIDSLSTAKNRPGDSFSAAIAEPIVINGTTIVGRGAKVEGRVVDAEGSGKIKGRANIRLALTSILDGGKSYPIVTKPFVAEAESTKGRDAAVIAGGAGIGAAIGALAGGKKGAAEGAAVGGVGGTGVVLATKGKEIEYGPETKLRFTLERPASLPKIPARL